MAGNRNLGDLQLTIKASTDQFKSKLSEASKAADGFKNSVKSSLDDVGLSADGLKASFAGMLAGLSVGAVVTSLYNAVDAMDKLNDVADSTGASIEGISKLENIALKVGENIGIVETALSKMIVQLKEADGTDNVSKVLDGIGLSWSELKSMDPAEGFQKIAVALSGYEDSAQKAQLMAVLFGKSYKELAPYIKDVAENMDIAGTVTADQAEQASVLKKQISALSAQYALFQRGMAGELLPTLIDIGKAFNSNSDDVKKAGNSYDWIKSIIKGVALVGLDVAYVFNVMGKEIGVMAAQLAAVARGDFKSAFGIGGMGDQWTKEAEQMRQALEARKKAISDAGNAPPPSTTSTGSGGGKAAPNVKLGSDTKDKKTKEPKAEKETYVDKLSEEAKAYGKAMEDIVNLQNSVQSAIAETMLEASNGGEKLTATQKKLVELFQSEAFLNAPDTWKQTAIAIAETTINQEKQLADQLKLNALLEATPTAQLEKQRELMAYLAKAFEDGRINAEQFSEAASTALGNIPSATKDAESSILNLSTAMSDAAGGMADAMIGFASGAKQSFGDFARSFLANLAKMIIQQMIFNALQKGANAMAGSGGWIGAIGSVLGGKASANGNVFTPGVGGPAYVPFANGGVFNSPMTFPMAGGKVGLMGEAGPEAIMPLTRIGGKLGVKAVGGGQTSVVNNISINVTGGNTNEDTSNAVLAKLVPYMEKIADKQIKNANRYGGINYR